MKRREKGLIFLTITIILLCLLFSMKVKKGLNCLSFDEMILRKVSMDDECLVDYIRKIKLFNPSTLPYNFTSRTGIYNIHFVKQSPFQSLKKDRDAPWIEALIAVETFVPKIGQRVFLECGALDGVTFSTTLHLERYLNWTGLLIEADARFYNDMKFVHRKAYGVHACASLYNHPSYALFKPSPIFFPVNKNGRNITGINPGNGRIKHGLRASDIEDSGDLLQIQCIPLYSLLLAVSLMKIDLFILDTEGVEFEILKTIPFEKVEIAVLMIEVYGKSEIERQKIHDFLYVEGYSFYQTFKGGMHPGDDIFIKEKYFKNSEYQVKSSKPSLRDVYRIITGQKDEDIDESDLETLISLSLPVLDV